MASCTPWHHITDVVNRRLTNNYGCADVVQLQFVIDKTRNQYGMSLELLFCLKFEWMSNFSKVRFS